MKNADDSTIMTLPECLAEQAEEAMKMNLFFAAEMGSPRHEH